MTRRFIPNTQVAKLVRAKLKTNFPTTKFSVTTKSYAGGSSITVRWTDGAAEDAVEACVGHYHGASFDGMIDLKGYHDSDLDGETVSFGNDYIFLQRELTDGFRQYAADLFCRAYGYDVITTKQNGFRCTSWDDGREVTLDYGVERRLFAAIKATAAPVAGGVK